MAQPFQLGVGCSVWQSSGPDNSNWSRFVSQYRWPFTWFGARATRGPYTNLEKSTDFWNRFKGDLVRAKEIGCNAFRFSFEWARIEPVQGQYDKQAIKRFHEILDTMEELGLEPNATLWHFTHPTWFEDLGGFTKEENIPIFVEWAQFMFRTFHKRIRLWATLNEPSAYIFLGFIMGMGPPGNFLNLIAAGLVLRHLLEAHTLTYWALKSTPGGHSASIGLVHHHITFGTLGTGVQYCFATWVTKWLTYWLGWDVIDHWMRTGEYVWKLPILGTWITCKDPQGKPPCDWFGINFYSRPLSSWCLVPACPAHVLMTDMYYPVDPDGLYAAIQRSSCYGIPLYITETGIADQHDDRRSLFIKLYVKAMLQAIADGHDVRGFYYWTLIDNFEWSMGYTMKFGLYQWEPDGSVDRVLKPGAQTLMHLYHVLPKSLQELRSYACQTRGQKLPEMGRNENEEPLGVDEGERPLLKVEGSSGLGEQSQDRGDDG